MLQTDIDFIALHLANTGRQYHGRPVVASLDHPEVAMMKEYWRALGNQRPNRSGRVTGEGE